MKISDEQEVAVVAVPRTDLDPGPAMRRDYRSLAAVAFVLSATFAALNKLVFSPSPFGDLRIYQLEGSAVRHGADLYGQLPGVDGLATYPPFAGLVFVIMTPLSFTVLTLVNLLLTVAVAGWLCVATARLCGLDRNHAVAVGLVVAAAGLWCEPVLMTLHYGQINVYLAALVMWDFTRRPGSRAAGIGTGLAAAIKVTPAIFVVYLVLTRRFAMAARAIGTYVAALLISLLVDARATIDFWTDHLFDTQRVGRLENAVNQTIRGWLARAHHSRDIPPAELMIVLVVAVLGLVAAARAYRVLGDRWGLLATAVTGLICSPIAWSHHWVWCLPVFVLLLVERSWWLLAAAVAVFFSYAVWWIPHGDFDDPVELHLDAGQVLASGWYVLFGLAFLAVTAYRTRAARTKLARR